MLRFALHLLLTMLVLLATLPAAQSQQITADSPTHQCPGADFQFPIKGYIGWLWHDPRSQWYDPATNTLPDTNTGNRLTGNPIIHTGLDIFPISQNASDLAVYPLADGVVVNLVGSQAFNIWYPQQRVYSYFTHVNHSLGLGQPVYANQPIGTVDHHIHFSISLSQTPPPQNPDGTVDKTKLPIFPFSDLDPNQTRNPSALFGANLADPTNGAWTGRFGPTVNYMYQGIAYPRAIAPEGAPKNPMAWTARESTFCSGVGTTSTDVFLLVDLSRSFADDLPVFRAQAPVIISALKALKPNIRFGLGKYKDYPIPPFGNSGSGDKAYERLVDLTPDTNLVLATIAGLVTRSGGDDPESQLAALFQAATGAGQNLGGVGFP